MTELQEIDIKLAVVTAISDYAHASLEGPAPILEIADKAVQKIKEVLN
jgi:hypothetical protein